MQGVGADELVCGTTHCVAGWAVRFTTKDVRDHSWEKAGAAALGFDDDLAHQIFMAVTHDDPHDMAELLRHLAKLDPADRRYWNPAVQHLLDEYLDEEGQ